jgi:hypothetical protein
MFFVENAFVFKDGISGISRFCTFHEPIGRALNVNVNGSGLGEWIVITEALDVLTVTA